MPHQLFWKIPFWGLIVLLVLLLLLDQQVRRRDAALMLPILELPSQPGAQPGALTERILAGFDQPLPDHPSYSPSGRIRALAPPRHLWHGLRPRTAHVFRPDGMSGPRPLILLFHGAGRDGLSQIEMWEATARRHGLILLAPNSADDTWATDHPEPALLLRLIEDLTAETPIDRNRIFLFGHSDGAAMAQILLNRSAGPWRAAALHAGGIQRGAMQPATEPKPMRLYAGALDSTFPPALLRDRVARPMAELGHPTEFLLLPGHTHWFYDAGPRIAEHAWIWMASLAEPH